MDTQALLEYEETESCVSFFFQAEDGIRDLTVTGVQTCALPIFGKAEEIAEQELFRHGGNRLLDFDQSQVPKMPQFLFHGLVQLVSRGRLMPQLEIGGASCRERG